MLGALAIAATFALASGATDLDAQLRSEARAYAVDGLPGSDVELGPRLELRVRDHASAAAAFYAPVLLLHPGADASPDGLHVFGLRLQTRSHRWTAQASAGLTYGIQDYTLLAPPDDTPGSRLQLVPLAASVGVLTGSVDASVGYATSHTSHVELGAGYLAGGGLDPRSRGYVPVQRSPHGSVMGEQALGHTDSLALRIDASEMEADPGGQSSTATQMAILTHRFGPETSLQAAGGVGELESTPPGGIPEQRSMAVGSATLSHQLHALDQPASGMLSVAVTPVLDQLTGEGYLHGEVRAMGGLQPVRRLSLVAALAAGAPVDSPGRSGELLTLAELGGKYTLTPQAELGLGARVVREQLVVPVVATVNELGGFASLTLTESVLSP